MPKKAKGRKKPHRVVMKKRVPRGAPPGTLVADPRAPKPVLRAMAYGPDGLRELEHADLDSIAGLRGEWPVLWVSVEGLGDAGVVEAVGGLFGLHHLALEDVLSTHQRAKVEQYGEYVFVVARSPVLDDRVSTEQMSLFLGPDFVLSFHEHPSSDYDVTRDRIRSASGRIASAGPDYLAYALIDTLIDGYFPVLEDYGERLEGLEEDVVARPSEGLIRRIHEAKRDLLTVRRAVWPLRDALSALYREPSRLVAEDTRVYLRDCYDHTIQIIDFVETYREIATGMMDVYLSSLSNRMNEIMKVLTIIATIFIPLSFIASLYGMNFNPAKSPWNMPELEWRWGYPFALGLMALAAVSMLLYFRRKGWLGGGGSQKEDAAEEEAPAEGRGGSGA